MSGKTRIVYHAKACTEALGADRGAAALAEAGVTEVIAWAGERGELIEAVDACRRHGLGVLSLSLPKARAFAAEDRERLRRWSDRGREAGSPAVGLIFGDAAETAPAPEERRRFVRWLEDLDGAARVENNGRENERFSSPAQLAALLAEAPGLELALDLAHLVSSGRPGADVTALRRRAAWVEVHDNDGVRDLHLPLGAGEGEGTFRRQLQSLGWSPGAIVIETDARAGDDPEAWVSAIRQDCSRLRSFLRGE